MKRPFLPVSLFLLLALAPVRNMQIALNDADFQPADYASPILQAEFQSSPEEVYNLYGANNGPARMVRTSAMRAAHRHDNWFVLVYGLFLLAFASIGYRLTREKYFLLLAVLTAAAAGADWLENSEISAITRALDTETNQLGRLLQRLGWWTWLKWLGLAAYFGVLAQFFNPATAWGSLHPWAGLGLLWACRIVPALAVIAALTRQPVLIQGMAHSITLMFGALFLFGLFYRKKRA
ncbi:MAG: hypothetical protein JNK89_08065 [Saprospiraceae bacterium]|nr:hypothetical protein [Saprospiraceae bacterium]